MIRVNFNLKEPSKDNSLIYLVAYIGEKTPLRFSTTESIPTQFWNKKDQRIKEVREFHRAKAINKKLDRYERVIKEIYDNAINPTPEYIRELFEIEIKGVKPDPENIFLVYYKKYLEANKHKSNIKSYRTTYNSLKDLMPRTITLSEVDYSYLDTYQKKYEKTKIKSGKSKGNYPSLNSIGTMIKNIKSVINDARKNNFEVNAGIKDFKKTEETSDSIYLTQEEVLKIYIAKVPASYETTKDIFIVGCCTAMRFGDYSDLSNIRGGLIYKATGKTGERVVVPVHYLLKEILEKYNYKLPSPTMEYVNRQIKEIGELAGINTAIEKTRTEGGKKITRTFEKWQLITTHTARRTGATNMYLAGIPTLAIMMITGHRTEKAFLKYIKVSKEQNALMLASHPFFNATPSPDL